MLAVVMEVATLVVRFGFGWQTTRDTQWLRQFTFGFRIHHGYVGLAMIAFAAVVFYLLARRDQARSSTLFTWLKLLWVIGIGLIVSDLAHHFLVIWPSTGSPQFDLIY
jgi:hypothetical protein